MVGAFSGFADLLWGVIIRLLAQRLEFGCWLFGLVLGCGLHVVAFVVFVLLARLVCLGFWFLACWVWWCVLLGLWLGLFVFVVGYWCVWVVSWLILCLHGRF